jgi:hypothetical protein
MPKKKKVNAPIETAPAPNKDWEYVTELRINGRNVVAGTELKIKGHRGRFRFVKLVRNGEVEWIDVWGGPKKFESMRSFRLEQVQRIHYKNQTVGNLAEEYKAKKAILKAEEGSNDV